MHELEITHSAMFDAKTTKIITVKVSDWLEI